MALQARWISPRNGYLSYWPGEMAADQMTFG